MGKDIPRNSGQQPKCSEGVGLLCSVQYAFWYRSRRKTQCDASHMAGIHIAKAQSRLGSINQARIQLLAKGVVVR